MNRIKRESAEPKKKDTHTHRIQLLIERARKGERKSEPASKQAGEQQQQRRHIQNTPLNISTHNTNMKPLIGD